MKNLMGLSEMMMYMLRDRKESMISSSFFNGGYSYPPISGRTRTFKANRRKELKAVRRRKQRRSR